MFRNRAEYDDVIRRIRRIREEDPGILQVDGAFRAAVDTASARPLRAALLDVDERLRRLEVRAASTRADWLAAAASGRGEPGASAAARLRDAVRGLLEYTAPDGRLAPPPAGTGD